MQNTQKHQYKLLDHGYLNLVDHMGSDQAIAQAARTSYDTGTKTVREDEGLVRYLVRKEHSSPLEMCDVKFISQMPIFVARQWVRHRTASLSEMSGRYSIMPDLVYIPERENMTPQSLINNQGRNGDILSKEQYNTVRELMERHRDTTFALYRTLLNDQENAPVSEQMAGDIREFVHTADGLSLHHITGSDGENNYPGIARELARMILPQNIYTRWVWKSNLRNLFNFIRLRKDPHAQYEIQVYAEAMHKICLDLYPATTRAFDDYVMEAHSFSRMWSNLIREAKLGNIDLTNQEEVAGFLKDEGCSNREITEFANF